MEKMERSYFFSYLIIILLLVSASIMMVTATGVDTEDEAGIVMHLPEGACEWHGVELRFCIDRTCGAAYTANQLEDLTVCPKCGGPLDSMNWAEKDMLPADTQVTKKNYTHPGGLSLGAAIVLSGNDRSSIHRPEVCQVAAGNTINRKRLISVPIEGREKPLEIMVLEMSRRYTRPDGQVGMIPSYYAYWFVGKDRETASHIQRMWWMAYDRVVHGVSHRWAYIATFGSRHPETDDYLRVISNFASCVHPLLLKSELNESASHEP